MWIREQKLHLLENETVFLPVFVRNDVQARDLGVVGWQQWKPKVL